MLVDLEGLHDWAVARWEAQRTRLFWTHIFPIAMGCSAGGQRRPAEFGHQMTIPGGPRIHEDAPAWDQSGLEDLDASFGVSQWHHLPDHIPGKPNRSVHDRHVLKLDVFLQKVSSKPSRLCKTVSRKRGSDQDPMVSVKL